MPLDPVVMNSELKNDPANVGYDWLNTEAGVLARMTNELGLGGVGDTVGVTFAPVSDLQESVVGTEYVSLTDVQRGLWDSILLSGATAGIDLSNTNIRGQITGIWTGTTTLSNITALFDRAASRTEIIYEAGAVSTNVLINDARRLG